MARFSNYGLLTGQTSPSGGQYTLQYRALRIPDGVYEAGDIVLIPDVFNTGGRAIRTMFLGYEEGTNYPVFRRPSNGDYYILTNQPNPGISNRYTVDTILTEDPIGYGVARFIGYGLRVGTSDAFNTQRREIDLDQGDYKVGDQIRFRIIANFDGPDGAPNYAETVTATFDGLDRETGSLLLSNGRLPNGDVFNNGRQIVITNDPNFDYNVPTTDIVAESWPNGADGATFSNYGFRQGEDNITNDVAFSLQGTGPVAGLEVPDGVYRVGDTLMIRPFGGTAGGVPVRVTYIGRATDPGGDFYPIFEAADFDSDGDGTGDGRAQFIGTTETGSSGYTPGMIVTSEPFATGVAVFNDYGARVSGSNNFNSQNRVVEFDQKAYEVGDNVQLRIITIFNEEGMDVVRQVDHTINAEFAGLDRRTGNPLFSNPRFQNGNVFLSGRQIFVSNAVPEPSSYTVDEVVAEAWPNEAVGATFTNYGFRQGEDDITNDVPFNLQGTSVVFGLDVPDGVHKVGETLTIRPFGGTAGGAPVEVTYIGRATDPGGDFYPIFEAANFDSDGDGTGDGRAQFIGTTETSSGPYTSGTLVTSEPLGVGVVTFRDYAARVGTSDTFNSQNREVEFDQKAYEVGDDVDLRIIAGRDANGVPTSQETVTAEFAGFDRSTGNPVFSNPKRQNGDDFNNGRQIVVSNAVPVQATHTVDEVVAGDWPLEPVDATFSNYGFRQGADIDNDVDFDLQGPGPLSGLDVPVGVHDIGAKVMIQLFAGEAAGTTGSRDVEVTVVGHVVAADGTRYPIFEAADFDSDGDGTGDGRAQFIGTTETGTGTYAPGMIVTSEPFGVGVATFADYGLRVGTSDNFSPQSREIEFDQKAYEVGDNVDLRIITSRDANGVPTFQETVTAEFAGFDRRTGNPLFSNPKRQNGDDFANGRQIVAASVEQTTYTLSEIVAGDWPLEPVDATFSNYGIRQGSAITSNGAFDLQGTGPLSGLDVPDGIYQRTDNVEFQIQPHTGDGDVDGAPVDVRFVGFVRDGNNRYPVFETADFNGQGRTQFIGTNLPDATATYTPTLIDTSTAYKIGDAGTFGNYGVELEGRESAGVFALQGDGPNDGLIIPDGIHMVGDSLDIRFFGGEADGITESVTFRGYHIVDGKFYPVFDTPDFDGQGLRARFIGTEEAGAEGSPYTPPGNLIETPFAVGEPAEAAIFTNYGFRQDDLTGDFTLRGASLVIPDGFHGVGDTLTIQPYGGGGATEVTYLGHVIDDGHFYPIFQAADFGGDGPAQFIGTRETAEGDYTPGTLITTNFAVGEPDTATFSNYGFRQDDLTGDFSLRDVGLVIPDGLHNVGDTFTIQPFGGGGATEVTYLGHVIDNSGKFYPILEAADFGGKGPAQFIGTDETGSGDYTPGTLFTTPFAVGEPAEAATFSNYGFRFDTSGDFSLRAADLNIPDGVHRVGDTLTIQPFGGGGGVSVTYQGYVIDDGAFYPVFEAADFGGHGRAQFIGTSEPDATTHYAAAQSDIIAASIRLGVEASFSNYGFRQAADLDGAFMLQGEGPTGGLNIPDDVYDAGDTLMIQPFGGAAAGPPVEVTYRGFVLVSGQRYPVFDAADFDSDGDGIGDGPARFIGTEETGTGSYTLPTALNTDTPFELGFARYTNYGSVQMGSTGITRFDFQLTGDSIEIPAGAWGADDTLTVRHPQPPFPGDDYTTILWGFHTEHNYPIFFARLEGQEGGDLYFMLTDEDGTGTFSVPIGDITITRTPDNPDAPDGIYVTCFAPGTLIATPDGERPVETLGLGDKVLTSDGGVETVKWVGVQKVPTMFGSPEVTQPVRIMAGALYENTPHTDLVVTKDHGMIVDGVICHAGALINGTSIVEVPTRELGKVATYYHVETHSHVPLLANGAAAESFIDNVDRARFNNHSEFVAMYGSNVPAMAEMGLPRAMSARQVPGRVTSRLATRAAVILGSVGRGPVARSA